MSELPLVVCEGASRTFGYGSDARGALRAVDLEVPAGARIAVSGVAGAGKSTLVHLLAGHDDPTGGRVRWPAFGERPEDQPGAVAVVFQGPCLVPPLTVEENVALGLMVSDLSPDDARVGARVALERLGVIDLAEWLPQELSAEQAQKVAVACALVAAADRRGAALLLCTPDPAVAARMDVRWALHDGRLIADRTTQRQA